MTPNRPGEAGKAGPGPVTTGLSGLRELIVPLDLASPATAALSVAAGLAARSATRVRLVIVASPGQDQSLNQADLEAVADGMGFEPVVAEVLESNDVVPALLAAAGTDGLICLPTRAHRPVAAMALGAVATELLLATTVPVLLVGPDVAPTLDLGLVEVCVDEPAAGAALVDEIGAWAAHLGLRLRVVHAQARRTPPSERHKSTYDIVSVARRASDRFGIDAEGVVVRGESTSAAIVEDASRHGAGIIAVAVRPRSRLRRRALGSTALSIAHTARAAVLAVPVPELG